MYMNRTEQTLLSVYVDDLKMAGKVKGCENCWEEINKHISLEGPKDLSGNTYLGVAQLNIVPPTKLIAEKRQYWNELHNGGEKFVSAGQLAPSQGMGAYEMPYSSCDEETLSDNSSQAGKRKPRSTRVVDGPSGSTRIHHAQSVVRLSCSVGKSEMKRVDVVLVEGSSGKGAASPGSGTTERSPGTRTASQCPTGSVPMKEAMGSEGMGPSESLWTYDVW